MTYFVNYFASVYGAGNYNESVYSTGTDTPTSTSGNSGVLANTGFDLILGVTIASVIIFTALIVRFWKKPAKRQPRSGN